MPAFRRDQLRFTGYRIGELELQEALGVLKGYADGTWREFDFAAAEAEPENANR